MAGGIRDKAEILVMGCSRHGDRWTDAINDSCTAKGQVHCRVDVGAQGA